MYYVEVKALGGPEGDAHYRSASTTRGPAMAGFWSRVRGLGNPLVDSEEVLEADGNYDTIITATGTDPDFSGLVTITMYWED